MKRSCRDVSGRRTMSAVPLMSLDYVVTLEVITMSLKYTSRTSLEATALGTCLLILFLLAFNSQASRDVGSLLAAQASPKQLWDSVVNNSRAEQDAIKSIEFEFKTTTKRYTLGDKQGPQLIGRSERSVRFERSGESYRGATTIKNDKRIHTGDIVVAYNGSVGTRRKDGTLMVGKSPVRLYSALPMNILSFAPATISEELADGLLAIDSAQMETLDSNKTRHSCIRVTFRAVKTGHMVKIWYDTDRGYLPIKTLDYDADGKLFTSLSIEEIAKVKGDDGRIFFCPIRGIRENTRTKKKSSMKTTVEVDVKSIRINHDIPESRFILTPIGDETVIHIDSF